MDIWLLVIVDQQDSISIYDMNELHKQTLQNIASRGNNYANAYARNILIVADSLQYNEPIILPSVQNKMMHKKPKTTNGNEEETMLKVFPNPAKNYFTVDYKLSKTSGSAVIEIDDLTGKKLRVLQLNDKQNQLIIETKDLQTGIYYIRLLIDGATSKIQKISIIK